MDLKLVIFDMDGVVFDSEKVYFEANKLAAEKLQMPNYTLKYYKQFKIGRASCRERVYAPV